MINRVELTLYLKNQQIALDINPIQAKVIFKSLGIKINEVSNDEFSVSQFSNETLEKFILKKLNYEERGFK